MKLSGTQVCLAVLATSCEAGASRILERADQYSASSFAGLSTSATFPVADATLSATEYDSYFPNENIVGEAGPTPTGDEAELLATATALPKLADVFPLVNPSEVSYDTDNGTSEPFNMMRSWGNLSPMWSLDADTFGMPDASPLIPDGCEMTQVHLIHRHGARYPADDSSISEFGAKLQNATVNGTGFTATGDLEFLNTWMIKLGGELLTPFGRQQLFNLGVSFRLRYGELLKGFTDLPVFRTTSEDRMVKSAQNFAAGFFGIPEFLTDYRQLIMIEDWNDATNNDTLAAYCENWVRVGDGGSMMQERWVEVYLQDAAARLQQFIDGVELTAQDAFAMQGACAYETVALGASAFCDLFTEEEWKGYQYAVDLLFWYGYGPGHPATAAQGIGYVQELVSRLIQTPIESANSSTNATITNNNITFPLDQPIYVDATHDTMITAILIAMNITMAENGPLPTDHIPDNQSYFSNKISPFAAQLVGQVMTCHSACEGEDTDTAGSESYIRWILNDAVVPLTSITACPDNKDGLCPVSTFVEGMKERIGEVDFNFDCNANYSFSWDDDKLVDGRPPLSERP